MRGLGLLGLAAGWRVLGAEHRMAVVPPFHPAGPADLALCALFVALLSAGLALTIWGPGLLREIDLPGHFPASSPRSVAADSASADPALAKSPGSRVPSDLATPPASGNADGIVPEAALSTGIPAARDQALDSKAGSGAQAHP